MKKKITASVAVLLLLSIIITPLSAFAEDNAGTWPGSPVGGSAATYYSSQYMWKVSLFVAKDSTVRNNTVAPGHFYDSFQRIGSQSVYLMPKTTSNGTPWVADTAPHVPINYSTSDKVSVIQELAQKGGNMSALNSVNIVSQTGVNRLQLDDLPYIPNVSDGNVNEDGVIHSAYVGNLSTVVNYFNNPTTIKSILKFYSNQQGTTTDGLIQNLNLTVDGVTKTGWDPATILPDIVNGNPTNRVEWLIVYEPVGIIYTRDRDKGYAFTATDYALTQIKQQIDWRYNKYKWWDWDGNQPDAWDDDVNRQHIARFTFLMVPNAVLITNGWYGFASGSPVDDNQPIPNNRWMSPDQLLYGGWGMSRWATPTTYQISYNSNGGAGSMSNSVHMFSVAKNLTNNTLTKDYTTSLNANGGTVAPDSVQSSCPFLGWSPTSAGAVAYSNSQSVVNLTVTGGATVPLYAKWSNATLSPLPTPTRTGYIFLGWYTATSGGAQVITGDSIDSSSMLYAHWEPIKYWVQFDPNTANGPGNVTGTMTTIQLTYDQPIPLPLNQYLKTTISNKETKYGLDVTKSSSFLGWSQSPTVLTPTHTNGQSTKNLTATGDATVVLYAIWDDSPKFIITDYPDRYFTAAEAQKGDITADELLRTVVAYDRESVSLAKGSTPGITVVPSSYSDAKFTDPTLGERSVPITYHLQDSYGHEAWLHITVNITSIAPNKEASVKYIRGIAGATYRGTDGSFTDVAYGGLDPNSAWLNNEAYTKQLDTTFDVAADGEKTETAPVASYYFSADDIAAIRGNVADHGFSTSGLAAQMKSGKYATP